MLVLVPNQARDVSLNTNVVTHQDSKECKKTTALFPSLFFLFSSLSFFFALSFSGAKTLLKSQQPKQRDCCTQLLSNQFQRLNFQTAGRESQVLLRRAQKELGSKF
jgi:hypothetical protein